ncbi:DNA polymerase III subunit gamma/tau [Vulcaniibacterium thermophilum]|uniref:DNA polymerase III subunit gamma/tau n=1 Tax=Vulcaniibacterium thermophilum TaxID=1169913 RepID=A0A918YZ47_9GAMM|nr:DNA polymerase III subunit gamma/tau [Vulcaniibacterium thermophilum]GHE29336.1 hypothetical protein GCM10007167_09020 [Vulcaniibacterium thermophilum]
MSYLVLARKWRPRRFAELVGQEHVVRALTNALDSGRVHHAFLFTGTRGVGKTTIARIFAKSLNCERGTSAEPCGECNACRDIDAGRFMDLLEIDAASNTGVDDVREVIENAQYAPSRGRVKVYLIDEVHMLSKAAFNALLKTLEEPPGHVKFLLATTDPQKLPVTVLSRCLQFNLKRLDEQQIAGQMRRILEAEGIAAEDGAIRQLARAADGSLRDGLSLLDQAIAYTGGRLEDAAVAAMLGTVDRTRVGALLEALADGDGARLLAETAALAEFSPDWGGVLDALAEALHRVQVRQLVPEAAMDGDGIDVDAIAGRVRPELVQLWYQMALQGRRELPYAPSPRAGFEMSVLRMLAFRPPGNAATAAPAPRGAETGAGATRTSGTSAAATVSAPVLERAEVVRETALPPRAMEPPPAASVPSAPAMPVAPMASAPHAAATASHATIDGVEAWQALVERCGFKGPTLELARHAGFVSCRDGVLTLAVDEVLRTPRAVKTLTDAVCEALGAPLQIRFEAPDTVQADSLHARQQRERDARQAAAEQAFLSDPHVRHLIERHGATVVPNSIRPLDE